MAKNNVELMPASICLSVCLFAWLSSAHFPLCSRHAESDLDIRRGLHDMFYTNHKRTVAVINEEKIH